jgi:hypothetical protein
MRNDTGQSMMHQPEPLARDEMERLWRLERQVTWLHISAMGVLLLGSVAIHNYGDVPWLRVPVLTGIIVLVAAAAVMQFRVRCPRCGTRLRSKLLTVLPDKCATCGVDFPRPPRTDE